MNESANKPRPLAPPEPTSWTFVELAESESQLAAEASSLSGLPISTEGQSVNLIQWVLLLLSDNMAKGETVPQPARGTPSPPGTNPNLRKKKWATKVRTGCVTCRFVRPTDLTPSLVANSSKAYDA